MTSKLTLEEKEILLKIARQALVEIVETGELPRLELKNFPASLTEPGTSFVTLTCRGMLRGCVGALEPYQSLVEDVRDHAAAAAVNDYRFPPVRMDELPEIEIEISHLTPIQPLEYSCPEDLLTGLRKGVDGVLLQEGSRRATFLPQVWEKIPDPADFLSLLCQKMGAAPHLWRTKKLKVATYEVEEFREHT